jgi:hypothetical protein
MSPFFTTQGRDCLATNDRRAVGRAEQWSRAWWIRLQRLWTYCRCDAPEGASLPARLLGRLAGSCFGAPRFFQFNDRNDYSLERLDDVF